jgi:sulfur-carrier protein adenylyltransferase/sulfurtransferase
MKTIVLPEVVAQIASVPVRMQIHKGETLQELMENLCQQYNELQNHLFYENGQLKDHFLFTSSGTLVASTEILPSTCTVEVMLASSGGHGAEALSNVEVQRYVRHITLPNVGRQGQYRLKVSKVLLIGTGGLGSPIAMYLAASGVGTLGLVDFDVVDESNLQRQIVHGVSSIGQPKVESAKRRLEDINGNINIKTYNHPINSDNAFSLVEQYDVVVDGTDNFATRYLVNEACVHFKKPLVYGAIYRFDGQVSVFNHLNGPCYRCLYPSSPPSELSPSCSAGGVIGVLPGVIGMIQATEVVKLIIGIGDPLVGRLLRYDALSMRFNEISFQRRQDCPSCSRDARYIRPVDVDQGCGDSARVSKPLPRGCYIEPCELHALLEEGGDDFVLLDIRDCNELEVCQLPGITHIPLPQLKMRVNELDPLKMHVLICYGGVRAERAAHVLMESQAVKCKVLRGGMKAWVREVDTQMPIY